MARDAKVIQRGVNVQANDFAVPAGTPVVSLNTDRARDGVAARRAGFQSFWDGLPWYVISELKPKGTSLNGNQDDLSQPQRGFYELFSRDRLLHLEQGLIWSRDSGSSSWLCVPTNFPHRITFFGGSVTSGFAGYAAIGIGRALWAVSISSDRDIFNWQQDSFSTNFFAGTPGNTTSEATESTATQLAKFIQPADVVSGGSLGAILSDNTTIRNISGSIIAGSITASGTTDGVGTAARFNGASWMAVTPAGVAFVADNVNQIRRVVVSSGSVTTFAGSTTAGDTDAVGTAARFRNISGMTYDGSQFLYVTEGSTGNRVRRIDVNTASVTIFAGTLTAGVTGTTDAVGTAARFNNPTGIEYVSVSGIPTLFVGDTGNNRIRKIVISSASVTTYTSTSTTLNTNYTDGIVPGAVASSVTPGVVLRGLYSPLGASTVLAKGAYLCIECTPAVTTNTIDIALVDTDSPGYLYHYGRCPSGYATTSNSSNKLDTWGVDEYGLTSVRGVDVGGGVVFSTSFRPRVIDTWTRSSDINSMPRFRTLGVEAPEAPSCTTVAGGSTFINNTAWAYRTVCGLTLPDGRIALGPPSERIIVTNTSGGTVNGSVTAFASAGLPYDGMPFVQVYRTKTASSSLDPGDQMFLCYEAPLAYGTPAVITDLLPDANLGAELYTNATQPGGFSSSSLPPPGFAREICAFNQRVVLGNYVPKASVRLKLLGTTSLVASTSTVTFTLANLNSQGMYQGPRAITLTAVAGATSPSAKQFQIATGGTAAQNAAQTARNIARCINRCSDAFLFSAYYDENDPGSVVVFSLYPGGSPSTNVQSLLATDQTFVQASIVFSTNAASSFITIFSNVATRKQNAIAFSDQNDFDSFPVGNQRNIGPSTEAIQRMLPISERVLAVKDDSIFSFDDTFAMQIYDTALACSLPNSFAKINNQWIGLFTRGFVALNATQAVAVGRPIDRDVTAQYSNVIGNGQSTDFASAAAIDVTGNYVCTFNDRTYVYNAISGHWDNWEINSITPQADSEGTNFYNKHTSGMRFVGAFRDTFITNQPVARGVFRQRNWRTTPGSLTEWYKDYSDMSWAMTGTLDATLQIISVSNYSTYATSNPMTIPPFSRTPPAGAVTATNAADADSRWMVKIEQGGNTSYVQGTVIATTQGSATSPVTVNLSLPLASPYVAGAATVTCYAPILTRLQYAPTATPGQNTNFTEVLATCERVEPGFMLARFFGRKDLSTAVTLPVGAYDDNQGVCRAIEMPSITSDPSGTAGRLAYNSILRFEVPSDRSFDQQIGVEFWECNAWQPLTFKSVVVTYQPVDNTKVIQ